MKETQTEPKRTCVTQTINVMAACTFTIATGPLSMIAAQPLTAPISYDFMVIASLHQAAPGGGTFTHDFEPNIINDRGDALFVADVSTGGEGVFLRSEGQLLQIARAGQAAPGGGIFDSSVFGPSGINEQGDVACVLALSPFSFPLGVNAGLYRSSQNTTALTPNLTAVPGGDGTFAGVSFQPRMNNQGDIVVGMDFPTDQGIHVPGEDYVRLGVGIFLADRRNRLHRIVGPGDLAPGGGSFDYADSPSINDAGDIAFDGHIAGEECITMLPQSIFINCAESVFLRKAGTGKTQLIAHQGAAAPGGGVFRHLFGPILNARGEMVLMGDLTEPPGYNETLGIYFYDGTALVRVAGPGDRMPGGGSLLTTSALEGNFFVNNSGEVVFNATLDTGEQGVYVWTRGSITVMARTGTIIPGVGVVDRTIFGSPVPPGFPVFDTPSAGAVNNDRSQILFGVSLLDGRGVLLIATPK